MVWKSARVPSLCFRLDSLESGSLECRGEARAEADVLGVRRLPIPSLRTPFPRPPAPHLSFPRLTDSTTTLYRQESSLLLGKVSLARACVRACSGRHSLPLSFLAGRALLPGARTQCVQAFLGDRHSNDRGYRILLWCREQGHGSTETGRMLCMHLFYSLASRSVGLSPPPRVRTMAVRGKQCGRDSMAIAVPRTVQSRETADCRLTLAAHC